MTSRFFPSLAGAPPSRLRRDGNLGMDKKLDRIPTDQRDIPYYRRPCSGNKSFMKAGRWKDISGHSICLPSEYCAHGDPRKG